MSRQSFREACVDRDDGTCLVPSCDATVTVDPDGPGEVHHIIERKLWDDGGYTPENGACVCNDHHRLAEENVIPPQAFWRWAGIEEPTVPNVDAINAEDTFDTITIHVDDTQELLAIDKWGERFDVPPWQEYRRYIKYPSTRHLPWSHGRDDDDTAHEQIDSLLGYPLVATVKMDGGNAMLVKDTENPVRARNGQHANKQHFDMCKQMYWENNLYEEIPEHLQIFGEWLYAKHSIHYGCDCEEECEDVGPALRDYFQVFGVYDTRYNVYLGWYETRQIADSLGLSLVPRAYPSEYEIGTYPDDGHGQQMAWEQLYQLSQKVVEQGHEGIVVRSALPFHYGQIEQRLGKYVRPGHVKEGEKHWSKRPLVQNHLRES